MKKAWPKLKGKNNKGTTTAVLSAGLEVGGSGEGVESTLVCREHAGKGEYSSVNTP